MSLSRRRLLQSLGLGAAWLPLLNSHRSFGQTPGVLPPNVIFISWPNGCVNFWPTGGVTNFAISQAEDAPLKPLTPWRDRLLLLGGIDIKNLIEVGMGGGHAAMPFLYTGVRGSPFDGKISDGIPLTAGGPSLDYWLASQIAAKEQVPASQRILAQRVHRLNGDDVFMSFVGAPVGGKPNPVQPYDNPVELFDKLFALRQQTDAERARLRAEKKSVLDVVGAQLERGCERMGGDDLKKCQAHLTAVREYEQVALKVAMACAAPAEPSRTANYLSELANPLVPEIHRLQMGMLVSAMACGLVRTGSLQWCNSHNNQYHFSWLASKDPAFAGASLSTDTGGGPSAFLQHHEIAHNENRGAEFLRRKNLVDQWFVQQVADLMQRLFDVKEAGKTLLDRTLIVFTNLQRTGGGHQLDDVPLLLAGNCNGYFKTGQFLRWAGGVLGQHTPMNAVLTEVCRAMGYPRDSYGDFPGNLPAIRA